MGTYRAPAVALMPDVTPKPLRSRANAIINLMGAVGGILYLGVAAVLYQLKNCRFGSCEHRLFIVVSAIMFVAVRRALPHDQGARSSRRKNQARLKSSTRNGTSRRTTAAATDAPKPVKKSLGFLLASIALWFIGY